MRPGRQDLNVNFFYIWSCRQLDGRRASIFENFFIRYIFLKLYFFNIKISVLGWRRLSQFFSFKLVGWGNHSIRLRETFVRIFFIFILKKIKFQKYMAVSKNFKTIPLSPPARATGGLSPPGWATGPKYKKKFTFRSWHPGRIKQRTCKIDIKS